MRYDAVIFDVDGVLTRTAAVHEAAWKATLDEVLRQRGVSEPFTHEEYLIHVDGRPRLEGLRAFLQSRGLTLDDAEIQQIAEDKNGRFLELLEDQGVEIHHDAVNQARTWKRQGLGIAFVSASRNAGRVLAAAGIDTLPDLRLDGQTAIDQGIPDKRAMFLEAARRLQVEPARAVVIEDASSGVAAARDGGFGLVVGLDRYQHGPALLAAGAHRVVEWLDELVGIGDPGTLRISELPSALDLGYVDVRLGNRRPMVFVQQDLLDDLQPLVDLVESVPVGVLIPQGAPPLADFATFAVDKQLPRRVLSVSETEDAVPVVLANGNQELLFRDLKYQAVLILVDTRPHPTHADLRLDSPAEVQTFLKALKRWVAERTTPGWSLRYDRYVPEQERLREALCTLGNGVFATRGAAEEAHASEVHYPGTYLAGGFDRIITEVAGEVLEHEDLVNWPSWIGLTFRPFGGEWLSLDTFEVLSFLQELDLRRGLLRRHFRVRDREGRVTRLTARRIVSMDDVHVGAISWKLTPENWSGPITVRASLDGTVRNAGVPRYLRLRGEHLIPEETGADADSTWLVARSRHSRIRMAQCARTRMNGTEHDDQITRSVRQHTDRVDELLQARAVEGRPIVIERVVSIFTSLDHAVSEPLTDAREHLATLPDLTRLTRAHERRWAGLWRRCDLRLTQSRAHDEERVGCILRLHLFHLLQVLSPHIADRDVGMPARGLHGEAYRGHVFWDEVFVFPFLNYTLPSLTRELLMYRWRRLPAARRLAGSQGRPGACYPWQSGSTGREESAVLHLNPRSGRWLPDHTHLQRHINAAIVYNTWKYFESTGDHEFLSTWGAEMVLEIARYLASLAEWDAALGRYRIRGVVGPDEFHTWMPGRDGPGLDDNAYTNVMTAWCLGTAERVLDELGDERRHELLDSLGLDERDRAHWQDVAHNLRVPFLDDNERVIAQFDGWDELEELDWEGLRARYGDIQRLDRLLEAEGDSIDRHKAIKQADVNMLFFLFSAQELTDQLRRMGYRFEAAWIPENVSYYERRTSHGSTLSRVVSAWVLARSDRPRAYAFLLEALRSDVADVQGGTTAEGIHLGAMAGTVDLVHRGFTGAVIRDGILWLAPSLPDEITSLQARFRVRAAWLDVTVTHEVLEVAFRTGAATSARVGVGGRVYELPRGSSRRFALKPSARRPGPIT